MVNQRTMSDPSAQPGSMITEAQRLIGDLTGKQITARLLGGLAVALRCPSAQAPSPLARNYGDYDIVVDRRSRRRLPEVLKESGFRGHDRFNAVHGHARQLYASPDGVELDVFIERFSMCHELDLKHRLLINDTTLPLADLILTKLQVAKLTGKDITDFAAIILDHPFTSDDHGINLPRITGILASDWGWWRTVTENLHKALARTTQLGLPPDQATAIAEATKTLLTRINSAPKSVRWKARATIGDRMTWREDPDEK